MPSRWLAIRLAIGLVAGSASGCAHGGSHRRHGLDESTFLAGTLATVALSVGAVLIAKEAGRQAPPAMPMPAGDTARPFLDEH